MKTKQTNIMDIQVGKNLKNIRMKRGFSQEKLAEHFGVTFQQVQKYENGSNRISASRIVQACEALNVSLEDIFAGTTASKIDANNCFTKSDADILNAFKCVSSYQKSALLSLVRSIPKSLEV